MKPMRTNDIQGAWKYLIVLLLLIGPTWSQAAPDEPATPPPSPNEGTPPPADDSARNRELQRDLHEAVQSSGGDYQQAQRLSDLVGDTGTSGPEVIGASTTASAAATTSRWARFQAWVARQWRATLSFLKASWDWLMAAWSAVDDAVEARLQKWRDDLRRWWNSPRGPGAGATAPSADGTTAPSSTPEAEAGPPFELRTPVGGEAADYRVQGEGKGPRVFVEASAEEVAAEAARAAEVEALRTDIRRVLEVGPFDPEIYERGGYASISDPVALRKIRWLWSTVGPAILQAEMDRVFAGESVFDLIDPSLVSPMEAGTMSSRLGARIADFINSGLLHPNPSAHFKPFIDKPPMMTLYIHQTDLTPVENPSPAAPGYHSYLAPGRHTHVFVDPTQRRFIYATNEDNAINAETIGDLIRVVNDMTGVSAWDPEPQTFAKEVRLWVNWQQPDATAAAQPFPEPTVESNAMGFFRAFEARTLAISVDGLQLPAMTALIHILLEPSEGRQIRSADVEKGRAKFHSPELGPLEASCENQLKKGQT